MRVVEKLVDRLLEGALNSMTRLSVAVFCALSLVACGGGSPTRPTPVTPPPQNFQGRWTGDYTIASCTATGDFRIEPSFCTSFRVNSAWPMVATLTQSGTQVGGTLELGAVSGPISGFVSQTNHLILNGTFTVITSGVVVTVAINGWDTTSSGSAMSGGWNTSWTASAFTGLGQLSHSIRILAKTS